MHNKVLFDNENNWNKIANSFDKTRRKPWDICINFIKSMENKKVILDIGCGNGRHLIPCSKIIGNCIGLDLSKNLLHITKEKIIQNNIKNVNLIHSNCKYLPIKDNSVNAVLYIATLHNIYGRNNRIKSLIEINRILKDDGRALISVWSRWQDKYRNYFFNRYLHNKNRRKFGNIILYWKSEGLNTPRFYHLYSKIELINDISRSGLKIISIEGVKFRSNSYIDNYFALVTKN